MTEKRNTQEKSNAQKWYEYALVTGDDSVARFMMYWIAFNFMYSNYRRKKDGKWNTERNRIVLLCRDRCADLRGYDPFTEDRTAIEKLIDLPVLRGRAFPERKDEPQWPSDRRKRPDEMTPEELWGIVNLGSGLKRTQCLLITLYQVRCNLFHGSKDPGYLRDLELVDSAATIMQGYLEVLLPKSHVNRTA